MAKLTLRVKSIEKAKVEATDDLSLLWAFVFIAALSAAAFTAAWGIITLLDAASP